jgi:hypothetical protein
LGGPTFAGVLAVVATRCSLGLGRSSGVGRAEGGGLGVVRSPVMGPRGVGAGLSLSVALDLGDGLVLMLALGWGDGLVLSFTLGLGDRLGFGVGVTALAATTRTELANRTMIVLVSFMEESFLWG